MYHSFLIHSSADGHLGCFHVLAIINSAVKNIGVHVSLSILVSSVSMPSSGGSAGQRCLWVFCASGAVVWGLLALLSLLHPPPQSKDSFNWEHAKRVKSSLRNSVVMETSRSVTAASGEPLWKWEERTCVSSDSLRESLPAQPLHARPPARRIPRIGSRWRGVAACETSGCCKPDFSAWPL